jgi:hypothetical protein
MFSTPIEIEVSPKKITYQDRIMTLGSCFSENIGKRMQSAYFSIDINPFGVLYNPISLLNSIELLVLNKAFNQDDIFKWNDLWQSFSHSSLFSSPTQDACLSKINNQLDTSHSFFKQTDYLIITLGTAWVFEEKTTRKVVSNCHKLPSSEFLRRRLTVEEIVADYSMLIGKLKSLFPNLQLIFSVSPIRHWKDGAHENNLSKSILLLAIDKLKDLYDNVSYFPAYEIQMDELRDYRFYDSDMLHPSEVAIDYIWKRFSETYFDEKTLLIKKELEQLSADLAHRPLQPDSVEFKKFQLNTEKKKIFLKNKYPFLESRIK